MPVKPMRAVVELEVTCDACTVTDTRTFPFLTSAGWQRWENSFDEGLILCPDCAIHTRNDGASGPYATPSPLYSPEGTDPSAPG